MTDNYEDLHLHAETPQEYITLRIKNLLKKYKGNPQQEQLVQKILEMIDKSDDLWPNELISNIKTLVDRNSCVFCGAKENLEPTRLVPKEQGGPLDPINLAMICSECEEKRGNKGIYEWWVLTEKKPLPIELEIQYETVLYLMHYSARTLKLGFEEFHQRCDHCRALKSCPGELSLLCLEGVIELSLKRL